MGNIFLMFNNCDGGEIFLGFFLIIWMFLLLVIVFLEEVFLGKLVGWIFLGGRFMGVLCIIFFLGESVWIRFELLFRILLIIGLCKIMMCLFWLILFFVLFIKFVLFVLMIFLWFFWFVEVIVWSWFLWKGIWMG